MGGGPASADVVRSSCLLTFPEETLVEPVPVDAWYLFAVGLTFLRRLVRDRIGADMRVALLMQKIASPSSSTDHHQPQHVVRRYVAVSSDDILRAALRQTFDEPAQVLVLHVISLARVGTQRSIHVRPEINPNVSPEPVAPMDLVFPTLSVDGLAPETSSLATSSMNMSMRMNMNRSVVGLDKVGSRSFVGGRGSFSQDKLLSQSVSRLDPVRDTEPVKRAASHERFQFDVATKPSRSQNSCSSHNSNSSSSFSALGAKLLVSEEENGGDTTQDHEEDIPLARVVGDDDGTDDEATAVAPRIPSDYVVLDLQNGAGLQDSTAADPGNNAASTFFISTNWHVYADELSASARLAREAAAADGTELSTMMASSTIHEASWMRAADLRPSTSSATENATGAAAMDESFVLLDRDADTTRTL